MKKITSLLISIIALFIFNISANASTYLRGIVTSSSVIKANSSSDKVYMVNDEGATMSLSSPEAVEVLGESGSYYQIKFLYSGFEYIGYFPKSNLTVQTYTTDDAYEQSLISLGFPADYANKLAILHAIHPNWTFTPSYTGGVVGGMDFYTAVNNEYSVAARNVISGSNTSLRSTADAAYQNGVWIPLAGDGWYGASAQTIAYYMDPRNFLDESHIFMFENGGYNPITQTSDKIDLMLSGTFMKNPFYCYETSNNCTSGTHTFSDTFLTAAQDKQINAVHLVTRVIQEQGSNGSVLSLGQGYNGEYIGYYNFFNIGASGSTSVEVITNGFIYAVNKNWNNQHISIYDGSSLLANNYVQRGQSTKYYQKFNTIAAPYYGNQYMQNVESPYSEGYSTYKSYYKTYASLAEWDTALYDFLIPIYTNMGTSTTLDPSQNSDSTLKSLEVAECTLNPEFQSSAYNYDCYTSKDTTELNVSAAATNANAKVENTGKISLSADEATVNIVVTAVNGQTSEYIINVHRVEGDTSTPSEILNAIGKKVSGNYVTNIEANSDLSNLINSVTNKYHFATITVKEANGTTVTEGIVKTGQIITITNFGITSTFTVVIYGDVSGDGQINIVDLLAIQKHLVKSKTLIDQYLNASDLNKDNVVDIRDLLLEQKHIVGAYTISQG